MTITTTVPRIPPAPAVSGPGRETRIPRLLLPVLVTAQFMALLDATIVAVALPSISTELHPSGALLELVVSAYTASYAAMLITGARLGAILGPRRVFLAGLIVFTTASLACALAPTAVLLVAARALQGLGAAAMVPQTLSVIQQRFPVEDRARALGVYSAVLALGGASGLVVGGLLIGTELGGGSWRGAFLVNVPVGLAAAAVGRRVLPRDVPAGNRGLDVPGLLTGSAALVLLVLPAVVGRDEGWPAWTWASLVAGALTAVWFVRVEGRVARAGGRPLVDLHVLRAPGFAAGLAALLAAMAAYGGYLFTLTLHLQSGLGQGPLRTGLVFAPAAVGFGAVGYWWRHTPASWHARIPVAGAAGAALGYCAVGLVLAAGLPAPGWLPALLMVLGLMSGASFSPLLAAAVRHVPVERAPDASGLLSTGVQLAQVVGVVVLGGAFLSARGPGAAGSGHALAAVLVAAGAAALLGAPAAWRLGRREAVSGRPG